MSETIPTKTCCLCKHILPISEFYKDGRRSDGLRSECKTCSKARVATYCQTTKGKENHRKANRRYNQSPKGKEYNHKYGQSDKGKESQRKYNQTDKAKERLRKHRQTDKGKETHRRYCLNNPEKRKAKIPINNAIRAGRLAPAWHFLCEVCHNERASEYHHFLGYAPEHRLDVIPVCRTCHKKFSKKIREFPLTRLGRLWYSGPYAQNPDNQF